MLLLPARCESSPSQAFPSPAARVPVSVSPFPVSGAPGAESPVLLAHASDGLARVPAVLALQFHAACTG